jgi:hypothetical protein
VANPTEAIPVWQETGIHLCARRHYDARTVTPRLQFLIILEQLAASSISWTLKTRYYARHHISPQENVKRGKLRSLGSFRIVVGQTFLSAKRLVPPRQTEMSGPRGDRRNVETLNSQETTRRVRLLEFRCEEAVIRGFLTESA